MDKKKSNEQMMIPKRLELLSAYKGLIGALDTLGNQIRIDNGQVWVTGCNGDDATLTHREGVIDIYSRLSMGKEDDPKETIRRFGVIGGSACVIELAINVNEHKNKLKTAIGEIKRSARADALDDLKNEILDEIKRDPTVRETLRRFGLSNLNIKQTTREICILKEQPKRIGFTYSTESSIVYSLSYKDAIKLAEKKDYLDVINKLKRFGESQRFAIARKQAPFVRANITYLDGKRTVKGRRDQVPAMMPILYPIQDENNLPTHNGVKTEYMMEIEDEKNLKRSKRSKINQDVYVDRDNPVSEVLKLYPLIERQHV